ncbi:MAG: cadmium-translocating P-type ATPase [Caldilineaceae bacterium]|nr:cadmium-translocating P-type ATPase [Caldilineaceae bacterium]MBP8109674.1 cadmium-translocating P-type ATPase [Caldilineaceae bacterium]MBP9073604.1 cadmium-translocating P-type ATPase [Caldilineaceae bacterium]
MTTGTLERTVKSTQSPIGMGQIFSVWRSNYELVLAAITLVALLLGWLGGEGMMNFLPGWAMITVALIAFAAGGYSGMVGAIEEAKEGKLDIDFLMIAAALGAAAIGQWKEGALLLFLFTLSGALEEFAMDRTRKAIEGLVELRPEEALTIRDGVEMLLAVDDLIPGDVVKVKPGDRLPVDGKVTKGTSSIDQSPITGESVPVYKEIGDDVFAGTINGGGALEVSVTKLASESTLSKIITLVSEAQQDAAPTQQFIDRFSQPYTLTVIAATLLAILIPWLFVNEPFSATLYRAMTLLVVASPCALIISTPASILSAIAAAARGGALFKGGAYLEKMAEVSVIAFDKTGTLTHGKPAVTDVRPLNNYSREDVIRMAAGAELLSEHPIARAVVNAGREMGLTLDEPQEFQAIAGHGVQAIYDRGDQREIIYIGNDKLFMSEDMDLSPAIRMIGDSLQKQGKTAMLVVRKSTVGDTLGSDRDWEVVGYIAVADTLRANAKATIQALRETGIERLIMLTGDNWDVANAIGKQVGIDEVHAELLPEQKLEIVRGLAETGKIAMIGDGVNDAPALATATVGIAMGAAGTDVAMETADIVLMADDLSKLPFIVNLSRRAERIVRQNIIFSIGVILTLVTLTVIVPIFVKGYALPLPLGVVGHEGSTLIVITNGLRMLAIRPK